MKNTGKSVHTIRLLVALTLVLFGMAACGDAQAHDWVNVAPASSVQSEPSSTSFGEDADGDGLTDADEITLGTDPNDADSDDDGVLDGMEPNLANDTDADGITNVKDPDSDDDGLFDGTEMGFDCSNPGTDTASIHCVPDADLGATTTNPLNPDSDAGSVPDGTEDADKNGRVDPGESDPNDPADDDKQNGQQCTFDLQCLNNFCVDGVCCQVSACTALDQCHDAGICQPGTGLCSSPNKADGSSCNDNDACTQSDICQSGICSGVNLVVCSPKDECHEPGTCDPSNGRCSSLPKPDGSPCANGTCQNAECIQDCQTAADCRPDPTFFDCLDNKCIPLTEGPLSANPGCVCSLPAENGSFGQPAGWILCALGAFWARRRRRFKASLFHPERQRPACHTRSWTTRPTYSQ